MVNDNIYLIIKPTKKLGIKIVGIPKCSSDKEQGVIG
jgi:hypothetical protein